MKYVMMETTEGAKLPFIFPDSMVHAAMAAVATVAIEATIKQKAQVVSAGFVSMGLDVQVFGASESQKGLQHNPADASRIMIGDSVAFMPDALMTAIMAKLLKDSEKTE